MLMSSFHSFSRTPDDSRCSSATLSTVELESNIGVADEETSAGPATQTPYDPKAATGARENGGNGKPVTMATIARAAGLSKGAVSSILNDRGLGVRVSQKTRRRVFGIC